MTQAKECRRRGAEHHTAAFPEAEEGLVSLYTDVVLTYSKWCESSGRLSEVNRAAFPEAEEGGWQLERPFVAVDAPDVLATAVLVASINYFRPDDFMTALRAMEWRDPACVQLFYKPQDYDVFTVVRMLDDGKEPSYR